MATRVVPLETSHQVKKFDCENADLNFFLQATAGQHQRKFLSKTYVLIDDDAPTEVLGFYTLAVRRMISKLELPPAMAKRLPRDMPGLSLARLAIDRKVKGQGLGEYLLFDGMNRARRVATEIGGFAIFVDAKDETAAAFYRRYGFTPFPDDPLILLMPFAAMPR